MDYGITITGTVPIRKDASEQSEMTSQLLFGELFQIIEKRKKWWFIKAYFDNYEGWIDIKTALLISEKEYNNLINSDLTLCNDIITNIYYPDNNFPIRLFPGSEIRNLNNLQFSIENNNYVIKKKIKSLSKNKRNELVKIGKQFLNSPYLWGGKSPFGIDCSGLSQILYKLIGIKLPRDAKDQVVLGTTINFINEAKPGDLAFFDNDDGNIIHVGLIIEPGKILHASGHVKIETIDHQGIYNNNTKHYSHKLRVIQQIIQD